MNIKCITFDKQAQDALPEEIKAKMKADRDKARRDRQLKEVDALNKNKMERTIEFRVWNGMEMVYDVMVGKFGIFYVNPANNGIDENDSACLTPYNTKYPDDIPLMQYTGLKDKNGVKIYEGDIVEFTRAQCRGAYRGSRMAVSYQTYFFCGFGFDKTMAITKKRANECNIIGNIYDNPEMIEFKEQQKQALIDTMRGYEELGLYDD